MSTDQALAVEKIATSGRRLDVLVGPAGTGKSTTMAGLRAAWEAEHGPGSVVGLAPSAAAAEVLGDELGIDTENTAKWLHEHRQQPPGRRNWTSCVTDTSLPLRLSLPWRPDIGPARSGPRPVVLPARPAGHRRRSFPGRNLSPSTNSVEAAGMAGAKILLVGDTHQLAAVDAGGMFRILVRDRDDIAPELSDVRRFHKVGEGRFSVELRVGNTDAIDAYEAHGRIVDGDRASSSTAYQAWREDVEGGKRR